MPISRSGVERIGDALRRPAHERSAFVAALLAHLHRVGFQGAPRALGVDGTGDQWFAWIEGEVPSRSPFVLTDSQLVGCARLVRGFHDAAESFAGRGGAETVTHGDLGPHNIVFRAGIPIAIIDWDAGVAPGCRIDDVAHLVWCAADLLEDEVPLARQAEALALMCRAYGGVEPDEVLAALQARFRRAVAQHETQGRPRAAQIFHGLDSTLTAVRSTLLAA